MTVDLLIVHCICVIANALTAIFHSDIRMRILYAVIAALWGVCAWLDIAQLVISNRKK